MLLWTAFAGVAWAGCAIRVSAGTLDLALAEAEAAFARLDTPALETAGDRARDILHCVNEPVSPQVAARVHRVEAYRAADSGDAERAALAFAAARRADPAYRLPLDLGSEVLDRLYRKVDPASARVEPLPVPAVGTLRVDGKASYDRPVELPAIVQHIGPAGEALDTLDVAPGPFEPPWPARLPEAAVEVREPEHRGWLVTAGIAALGSAALYGGAWAVRTGPYEGAAEDWAETEDPDALRRGNAMLTANRALVVGSVVAGTGALGAGAVGVIRWVW